jgi:hypothetical protein
MSDMSLVELITSTQVGALGLKLAQWALNRKSHEYNRSRLNKSEVLERMGVTIDEVDVKKMQLVRWIANHDPVKVMVKAERSERFREATESVVYSDAFGLLHAAYDTDKNVAIEDFLQSPEVREYVSRNQLSRQL